MIVDAKVDYKNQRLVLVRADGGVDEKRLVPPYFYVIVHKSKKNVVRKLVDVEDISVEETQYIPIVFKGYRYEPDNSYVVLKVFVSSPRQVPEISGKLHGLGLRVAVANIRYVIRNVFDHNVLFFDTIPLYYSFDPNIIDNIAKARGIIIDVEAVEGRPVLASVYWYRPFEEVRRDDVECLWLPEEADRLQKLLNEAPVLLGHNIVGFDIPLLRKSGIYVEELEKALFDTSLLLSTHGFSLGVGSARSLLDVSTILKKDAGISDEEIELKKSVRGKVDTLSKEDLVKYNVNDVVLTAKLLNIFYPFATAVSALTQIPISEILTLPAGMVAEYFLLRYCELLGYIPEYRETNARISGERVWLESEGRIYRNVLQTDVKMMFPSYVLYNYVDPTLHVGGKRFDRKSGLGILYSAVLRLKQVRDMTRKLKKENPLFDPVDRGVKAILNALAYGVQGKQSGLAIMGNPWCPEKIFYGTMEAQFEALEELRKKGVKVVYSDTDSFFIELGDRADSDTIYNIILYINSVIGKYGLEVDVEDVWEQMYIYSKKNYILKKGHKLIVKGGALKNLDKIFLPECVKLAELLKTNDRNERLKIVKEAIYTAPLEDLFTRGHQQVWRLIGKDVQAWKKSRERRSRYMRVLTPWAEKPTLILKKARGGQLLLPHTNPILRIFLEHGNEVELEELNPFNIVELLSLKYTNGILVLLDKTYYVEVNNIYYGIRVGQKLRYIPMWYEGTFPPKPIGILEKLKADIKVEEAEIEEEKLRNIVYQQTIKTLKEYKLL